MALLRALLSALLRGSRPGLGGPRAGGRGEAESSGHELPSGPRLCWLCRQYGFLREKCFTQRRKRPSPEVWSRVEKDSGSRVSSTVNFAPKMISDLFKERKVISFQGCIAQMFFIHVIGGTEMVLLIAMALDRYVAICRPLHYLTIMNFRTCILLLVVAWTIGIIHSLIQLVFVVNLPFCGPNEVDSFYCDLPRFISLACTDTYRLELMVTANSGFISLGTFFILVISYIFILVIVWQRSSGGLSKALSTLSAHITVVVLFFGPCIFVYSWPFPTVPVDKFLAIFDVIITPFLNPAIYTFRNKEMKVAMRTIFSQVLSSRKLF
ncbi:olfactory receptor 4F21-like [Zalophus californianus]|uniref:Olfactory receptor n=1 Tax=Zalophus californianus TaxID=9704 RepID=A0A6J2B799_ZALCA|nr:olfactory receptor 4F21-like [Zalophus californianus]